MSGILLVGTFVFIFFFGYHMADILDHFLDTNRFYPQDDDIENIIQSEELSGQELTGFQHTATHRAS